MEEQDSLVPISEDTTTLFFGKLLDSIEAVPQNYYGRSIRYLEDQARPNLTMYRIKANFWREIDKAQKSNRKVVATEVFRGVCKSNYFWEKIVANVDKMAWLLTPLEDYEDQTKAALNKAITRYDELLNMEITSTKRVKNKATGEYEEVTTTDPKKAMVLLSVIKNLEERRAFTFTQINLLIVNQN